LEEDWSITGGKLTADDPVAPNVGGGYYCPRHIFIISRSKGRSLRQLPF